MTTKTNRLSIAELYNEIFDNARASKKLSKILPSVLILSKQLSNKDLEKWTELELNGYFDSNKALTKDVIVPIYRKVGGQHSDIYGRPLIISDPGLKFVGEYHLRQGVSELEKLSKKEKLLSIHDATFTDLIKQHLDVEVHSFSFSPISLVGILDSIRTNLINKLIAIAPMVEKFGNQLSNSQGGIIHNAIERLHPLIQPVASQLYADGHYRQAILDTYILLVNTVKSKSGRHDLEGTGLMQTVFSAKNPIIKISDNPDEQLGFMWMFSGAVMGIRNPKAHKLIRQRDPQRTLEWLSYASVLLRVLDDAEVLKMDNS